MASVTLRVDQSATAATAAVQAGEAYPEVLATPVMIREMERACAAVLRGQLGPGEMSVGVRVEVAHLAPTPLGLDVTSHARFLHQEKGLYWFEVWSEDQSGIIGKGRHARAIVDAAAIIAKAEARRASATGDAP